MCLTFDKKTKIKIYIGGRFASYIQKLSNNIQTFLIFIHTLFNTTLSLFSHYIITTLSHLAYHPIYLFFHKMLIVQVSIKYFSTSFKHVRQHLQAVLRTNTCYVSPLASRAHENKIIVKIGLHIRDIVARIAQILFIHDVAN